MQEYRDVGSAVQKAAELSALGLNIAPTQIMQMAYDPANLDKHMYNMFSKMEGMNASSQFALADKMAPMFSMSRDQFMKSLEIAKSTDGGISALAMGNKESLQHFKEQTLAAQDFSSRLDHLLASVVAGFIDPVVGPLVAFLDKVMGWMVENTWAAKIIAGAVVGIYAIQKVKQGVGMAKQWAFGGIDNMFSGDAAGGAGKGPKPKGIPKPKALPQRDSSGRFTKGSKGMFGKMNANALLKGAAAMVIMAGAMWVMGKALQQFEGLDWKHLEWLGQL